MLHGLHKRMHSRYLILGFQQSKCSRPKAIKNNSNEEEEAKKRMRRTCFIPSHKRTGGGADEGGYEREIKGWKGGGEGLNVS